MSQAIPDQQAIEEQLAHLIRERLLDLPDGFASDTNLYEAGLDSMGIMHLLLAIEDGFGILLPEADVSEKNFCTLANLSRLLRTLLARQ
ncbi:MAG TPA: phosphopantetheine-binding protein [Chthoniobacteraceae bacterium]|nr:phosphopantetheine-binding protein [Chthoniobacteraceae bacterium]